MTKIAGPDIIIVNVYRSKNAPSSFISELAELLEDTKTNLLCGDFNFCYEEEKNHQVLKYLSDRNFKQIVQGSTHKEGRCLDQVYIRVADSLSTKRFSTKVVGCYYSDHDTVVTIMKEDKKCLENGDGEGDCGTCKLKGQDFNMCSRRTRQSKMQTNCSVGNGDGEGDG